MLKRCWMLGVCLLVMVSCAKPSSTDPNESSLSSVHSEALDPIFLDDKAKDIDLDLVSTTPILNDLKEIGADVDQLGFCLADGNGTYSLCHQEDHFFYAASTTKVIVAMAYLDANANKESLINYQAQETLLDSFIASTDQNHYQEDQGAMSQSMPGQLFTVEDALATMIVDSDNTAASVLIENLPSLINHANSYSQHFTVDRLFHGENMVQPAYMLEALTYLVKHRGQYEKLWTWMEEAPDYYGINGQGLPFYKKYGLYLNSKSTIGILYKEDKPYIFVLYCQGAQNLDRFTQIGQQLIDSFLSQASGS